MTNRRLGSPRISVDSKIIVLLLQITKQTPWPSSDTLFGGDPKPFAPSHQCLWSPPSGSKPKPTRETPPPTPAPPRTRTNPREPAPRVKRLSVGASSSRQWQSCTARRSRSLSHNATKSSQPPTRRPDDLTLRGLGGLWPRAPFFVPAREGQGHEK